MKGGVNLRDLQQKRLEASKLEDSVTKLPCRICGKTGLKGPYGRTMIDDQEYWSCSATCEKEMKNVALLHGDRKTPQSDR